MKKLITVLALFAYALAAQVVNPPTGGGGGGTGTVTSVTIAGTANKISVSGTCTITTTGTCTATIPDGVVLVGPVLGTPASGTLTNATGLPAAAVVAGALANGITATTQSASDNSTKLATTAYADAVGTASKAFSALTSGTNTGAAMLVGTGASLAASGSGTITATAIPVGGITGLGTGVGTWLATPSSANLASAMTDESGTGALIFADSPTFTTTTTTTATNIGTGSTAGMTIKNTTAAAAGAQQNSQCLVLEGQGWKTTATAASQAVDWCLQAVPVQGAANPTTVLQIQPSINGGAYGNGIYVGQHSSTVAYLAIGGNTSSYPAFHNVGTRMDVVLADNSAGASLNTAYLMLNGNLVIDIDSTGVIGMKTVTGTTAANYRALKLSALYHGGTTFTLSTNTCSGTSLVGGATGGSFVSGTTGTCSGVVTMGNTATTATGWNCSFNDRTTGLNYPETASSTTTATFSFTTATNDAISFACTGF